jgi:hypothetical protein
MDSMSNLTRAKIKPTYDGLVSILNLKTGDVVAEASGHFDVSLQVLTIGFEIENLLQLEEYLPVIKTEDGYFSPSRIQSGTFVSFGGFASFERKAFSMESYFNWPTSAGLKHIIKAYSQVTIYIKGLHARPESKVSDQRDVSVTQRAVSKAFGQDLYGDFNVEVKSRWATVGGTVNANFVYQVKTDKTELSFRDWIKLLSAFKLYWLLQHDFTDCKIISIELGDGLSLFLGDYELRANKRNVQGYKDSPDINDDFNPLLLAKTLNFFKNDTIDPKKGYASKISLALNRLLYYRFTERVYRLEDEAVELIFALDGFTAQLTKDELKKRNRARKSEIKESIEKVLKLIDDNKADIIPAVSDFYIKPVEKIYENVIRLSFKDSTRLCFELLGIDYDTYEDLISVMDRARQQVVHSQNYDSEYLIEALLTRGVIDVQDTAEGQTITFGQSTGKLDEFYDLLKLVAAKYFNKY